MKLRSRRNVGVADDDADPPTATPTQATAGGRQRALTGRLTSPRVGRSSSAKAATAPTSSTPPPPPPPDGPDAPAKHSAVRIPTALVLRDEVAVA